MNAIGTAIAKLVGFAENEPVVTIGILRSAGMVILAFWPGLVSPAQAQAIDAFALVLLGVDQAVRSQVKPA